MIKSLLKKASRSSLLKESMIYGLTNALYSGLPIFILPLLLAVLQPDEFGMVEFYRISSLLLTPILGLSTIQSISRYYFDLEKSTFKTFVSNIIYLHFVNALIGVIILSFISYFIPADYSHIVLLCIVYFLFNQITEALLSIFRVEKKPKKYLAFRILNISLDLSLLAILYFQIENFDWTYRVYPNVLSVVIVGLLALFMFYKYSYFKKFDGKLLKQALIFSSPLILHMISGYMMNMGDRFFILYFLTPKDLGNYSVAYQLGMLVNFLYTSFNLAWVPTFFGMMEKKQYDKINKIKILTYVAIAIFGILILLMVSIMINYTSMFENYNIQMRIIIIIVIAYIFNSIYKFESNYFFYSKETKILSFMTLGAATITIILNLLLIPKLGILGCAIATLVSQVYMFASVAYFRRKSFNKKCLE